MTTLVFGHKSPDTDSTGSPIIWAWYLNEIKGQAAKPVLLGEPNTEAAFVLKRWNLDKPEIVTEVAADTPVVIVDTNNPAELPAGINACDITAIIDHHKLVGGLETKGPIDIRIEPLACTATIMWKMIGKDMAQMPTDIKGAMPCPASSLTRWNSARPTTTQEDKAIAHDLAKDLGHRHHRLRIRHVRRQIRCLRLLRRRAAAHGLQRNTTVDGTKTSASRSLKPRRQQSCSTARTA